MALTKTNGSLTQLTASGNSAAADIAAAYGAAFSIAHVNGTGTITVRATVQPQISYDGVAFVDDGPAFVFSDTASAAEERTYVPPANGLPIDSVRFVYTAPTGSTGHTLDVSYGLTTEL